MLISDTSLTLQSGTGLPTATAIELTIDATDPVSGAATPTLKETVIGTLSGTTLSNLVRGVDGTTQQAHASGANVTMWIDAKLWNDFQTSYLTQHKQLGAHVGITTDTIDGTGAATFDTINEHTASTGVTIEGVNIQDSQLPVQNLNNPYKFSVYRNSAQSLTANSFTKIQFDSKLFDTNSNFDATTNFRYTAPASGFYQFNVIVSTGTIASLTRLIVSLYKNGSEIRRPFDSATGDQVYGAPFSSQLQLAANDYIEVWADAIGANAPLQVGTSPYFTVFEGFLVSAT